MVWKMKKKYQKPELNTHKIDTVVSLCMPSGNHHHHHHHHGNSQDNLRHDAFGGNSPADVSGLSGHDSPW